MMPLNGTFIVDEGRLILAKLPKTAEPETNWTTVDRIYCATLPPLPNNFVAPVQKNYETQPKHLQCVNDPCYALYH